MTRLSLTCSLLLFPAVAIILCAGAQPSHAQTYGDAQWCAVISPTDGDIEWDCRYKSAEECAPNVIAGQRGFCNVNPYWSAASAAPASHGKHRPRRVGGTIRHQNG